MLANPLLSLLEGVGTENLETFLGSNLGPKKSLEIFSAHPFQQTE